MSRYDKTPGTVQFTYRGVKYEAAILSDGVTLFDLTLGDDFSDLEEWMTSVKSRSQEGDGGENSHVWDRDEDEPPRRRYVLLH